MKRKQIHRQTIRFRRWSRKSYAAFASIGRCVTIGCLRKNVADSSLRKQDAVQTIPYFIHTMTINELKAQVLAGIDISPDQAAWLANTADREALYAAAHEITVQCAPREFRHVFHHQCQIGTLPRKLQMVRTIFPLPYQSRNLRPAPRRRVPQTGAIQ